MSFHKEKKSQVESKPAPVAEAQAAQSIDGSHKLKILLVEDNKANQLVVKSLLKKCNCTIEITGNGLEAIDALKEKSYDLVLMDIQMPLMDGIEATKRIRDGRAETSNPQIPIIAITAHARQEDQRKGYRAGMDDYVTKPVSRTRLLDAIQKLIG